MVYKANIRPAWVVLLLLMAFVLAFSFIKTSDTIPVKPAQPEQEKRIRIDLSKFKKASERATFLDNDVVKLSKQSKYLKTK